MFIQRHFKKGRGVWFGISRDEIDKNMKTTNKMMSIKSENKNSAEIRKGVKTARLIPAVCCRKC